MGFTLSSRLPPPSSAAVENILMPGALRVLLEHHRRDGETERVLRPALNPSASLCRDGEGPGSLTGCRTAGNVDKASPGGAWLPEACARTPSVHVHSAAQTSNSRGEEKAPVSHRADDTPAFPPRACARGQWVSLVGSTCPLPGQPPVRRGARALRSPITADA